MIEIFNFLNRAFDKDKMIMVLLLPLYVLIRIIRPIVLIRFGSLKSYRIGHFAGNIEMYMCERDHGIQPKNVYDIFYIDPKSNGFVCNRQLLKMWKRIVNVNQIALYLNMINLRMSNGGEHIIKTTDTDKDVFGLMEKTPVHLYFTSGEKLKGKNGLKKVGIEENSPFICLANRDSAYLDSVMPGKDWSYHRMRYTSIQNSILAADWLTSKDYFVVRMGIVVKERMQTNNPMIIDYANQGYRTDLLDIYLGANCTFFLSHCTGIDAVSRVFRRPILYVNNTLMEATLFVNSDSLTINKKLWLIKECRFMTFKEIVDSGASRYSYAHEFEELGVELIENTSEEILNATIEMYERLKGTWQTTDEDEELQSRFWSVFPENKLQRKKRARIGAKFLRDNRELLN